MSEAFSGNRMMGVAFGTQAIAITFTIGTFGLFLEPMEQAFGASRAEVSLGLALMSLFMNVSMPFIGKALDTRSIRHLMTLGAILNALALFVVAMASSLWQMLAAFAVLASIGTAMLGPVAGSTLMANWFRAKRGQALGIINMGAPAGIMLVAPVAGWAIGAVGWRATMTVYALTTLLIAGPAAWFGVVNHPRDLGQRPDGGSLVDETATESRPERQWSTAEVLRNRPFWALSIASAIPIAVSIVLVTHLVAYGRSLGMTEGVAATLLSVQAGSALGGTLLLGWLSDRMSSKWLLAASILLQAAMVMIFFATPSHALVVCAVAVLGMCFGGMMPLLGTLIGQHFGAAAFGQVLGLAFLVQLPFAFAGPPVGGAIFDRDGSYDALFPIIVLGYAAALVILLTLLPKPLTTGPLVSGEE